ncbi:galactose/glucose ABC transporter substrate-binding protein MglB [Basfia succiniciproducens]|uniref:D-galactose/methyl-galactoside binding periplasmic protein MglB n=1 Tax=Basfia succiniciproducens TaxID=653940 RepID=A0A1G5BCA2_9PAST|nr:galactose/glucose ABC transporter substrate-binding protein MglB [Basfia succiniciproducens]QIM68087.1 galactose ABC transporter substrate-binding protein [Basfia succiniciproducens]SCX87784.1 monosaccharide ABC transporter substrate-binding protein, CUT2 family [Basfia succiniciproducens]
MKKLVLNTVAISVLLGSGLAVAQTEPLIGVTIYQYDDNFMNLMLSEINKESANFKDVRFLMNDSQNSQAIQNNQIDILLAKKVKVLAVNLVDPPAAKTVIAKAKKHNVPVIFFNKDPGAKLLASYNHAYYVGSSPKNSALEQAKLIAKHWNANKQFDLNQDGKIQFAMLTGQPDSTAAEVRSKYVIEELHNLGIQTEALFVDTAMWNGNMARDRMELWLNDTKGKQIEMVIANNDAMALGALESLSAQNKQLPVFGIDALPETLTLIKTGKITATVLNDGAYQSKVLVELARNLALGKSAAEGMPWKPENNSILSPDIAIDKDNVEQYRK